MFLPKCFFLETDSNRLRHQNCSGWPDDWLNPSRKCNLIFLHVEYVMKTLGHDNFSHRLLPLALWPREGNKPVNVVFLHCQAVHRFYFYFAFICNDVSWNKLLNELTSCQSSETPLHSCVVLVIYDKLYDKCFESSQWYIELNSNSSLGNQHKFFLTSIVLIFLWCTYFAQGTIFSSQEYFINWRCFDYFHWWFLLIITTGLSYRGDICYAVNLIL